MNIGYIQYVVENLIKPSFQFTLKKGEMISSNKHKERKGTIADLPDSFLSWARIRSFYFTYIYSIRYLKKKWPKHQASLFCNFIVVHKLYIQSAKQSWNIGNNISTATPPPPATMQTTCHRIETSYTFDISHGKYCFAQGLSLLFYGVANCLNRKQAGK